MSANYSAGTIRDVGTWHAQERLTGGIFSGDISVSDALSRADMHFAVDKRPEFVVINGAPTPTEGFSLVRSATTWDPSERRFATVGPDYIVSQVDDMAIVAEMLQQAGAGKRQWPLEHVCALRYGEIVIFLLKLDSYDVQHGGQHNVYVLYSCHYDGKTSGKMGTVGVRVVCENTYRLALGKIKEVPVQLPHRGSNVEWHKLVASVLINVQRLRDEEHEFMQASAKLAMNKAMFASFLESSFPEPSKPKILGYDETIISGLDGDMKDQYAGKVSEAERRYNLQKDRVSRLRMETAMNYSKFNDQFAGVARTGYAAFSALSETTTHSSSWMDRQMISSVVNPEKARYISYGANWLASAMEA